LTAKEQLINRIDPYNNLGRFANTIKMKFNKLFLLVFALMAFTFVSCGDSEEPNGCMKCKLAVPLLSDCEIEVCEDGASTTLDGGTACAGGEAVLIGLSTQAEKVQALTDLGFSCN